MYTSGITMHLHMHTEPTLEIQSEPQTAVCSVCVMTLEDGTYFGISSLKAHNYYLLIYLHPDFCIVFRGGNNTKITINQGCVINYCQFIPF